MTKQEFLSLKPGDAVQVDRYGTTMVVKRLYSEPDGDWVCWDHSDRLSWCRMDDYTLVPSHQKANQALADNAALSSLVGELVEGLDTALADLKEWHTSYSQGGDGGIRSSVGCDGCSTCDAIGELAALIAKAKEQVK